MNIKRSKNIQSILVSLGFALFFSFWGMVIYFLVGEAGPDSWFIRPQRNAAASSYSIHPTAIVHAAEADAFTQNPSRP
jgi:hypothetical protein